MKNLEIVETAVFAGRNDGVLLIKENTVMTVSEVESEVGANLCFCVTKGTDEARYDKNNQVLENELGLDLDNIDYVAIRCNIEDVDSLPLGMLY